MAEELVVEVKPETRHVMPYMEMFDFMEACLAHARHGRKIDRADIAALRRMHMDRAMGVPEGEPTERQRLRDDRVKLVKSRLGARFNIALGKIAGGSRKGTLAVATVRKRVGDVAMNMLRMVDIPWTAPIDPYLPPDAPMIDPDSLLNGLWLWHPQEEGVWDQHGLTDVYRAILSGLDAAGAQLKWNTLGFDAFTGELERAAAGGEVDILRMQTFVYREWVRWEMDYWLDGSARWEFLEKLLNDLGL